MAPALKCPANYTLTGLYLLDVNCTRHYPYLNGEVSHLVVLRPVPHPVNGVVVALVGDLVLLLRPCWLHVLK